ncbi:MAG: FxLYD domain-containing protein, partial [Armatimonadota bacterium]
LRTVPLAGALALCLMTMPQESHAQADGASLPSAVPVAAMGTTHRITYPFYAGVSRTDMTTYLEYRYLTGEGIHYLWPVQSETGEPGPTLAGFYGIKRGDYDRELAKRRTEAEGFLSSGRVVAQQPQQVRLVRSAAPDFSAWNTLDRQGVANFAARGSHHETMRLVELLDGPQKGQHVWTTARLSNATEPERVGWAGSFGGGGSTGTEGMAATGIPSGPSPVLFAKNVGMVYDSVNRVTTLGGTVTNTTEQAVENVEVEVIFVNQGGAAVARDRAVSATRLDPGQSWTFSIPWPSLGLGATNGQAVSVKATPAFGSNTATPATKSKYK